MNEVVKILLPCLAMIGGALAWSVSNFVSADTFDDHMTAEERRYVLSLKANVRDINKDLKADPDNEDLEDDLQELIDELCELRPSDRLCK